MPSGIRQTKEHLWCVAKVATNGLVQVIEYHSSNYNTKLRLSKLKIIKQSSSSKYSVNFVAGPIIFAKVVVGDSEQKPQKKV